MLDSELSRNQGQGSQLLQVDLWCFPSLFLAFIGTHSQDSNAQILLWWMHRTFIDDNIIYLVILYAYSNNLLIRNSSCATLSFRMALNPLKILVREVYRLKASAITVSLVGESTDYSSKDARSRTYRGSSRHRRTCLYDPSWEHSNSTVCIFLLYYKFHLYNCPLHNLPHRVLCESFRAIFFDRNVFDKYHVTLSDSEPLSGRDGSGHLKAPPRLLLWYLFFASMIDIPRFHGSLPLAVYNLRLLFDVPFPVSKDRMSRLNSVLTG